MYENLERLKEMQQTLMNSSAEQIHKGTTDENLRNMFHELQSECEVI